MAGNGYMVGPEDYRDAEVTAYYKVTKSSGDDEMTFCPVPGTALPRGSVGGGAGQLRSRCASTSGKTSRAASRPIQQSRCP
jgi:hypothetical protein